MSSQFKLTFLWDWFTHSRHNDSTNFKLHKRQQFNLNPNTYPLFQESVFWLSSLLYKSIYNSISMALGLALETGLSLLPAILVSTAIPIMAFNKAQLFTVIREPQLLCTLPEPELGTDPWSPVLQNWLLQSGERNQSPPDLNADHSGKAQTSTVPHVEGRKDLGIFDYRSGHDRSSGTTVKGPWGLRTRESILRCGLSRRILLIPRAHSNVTAWRCLHGHLNTYYFLNERFMLFSYWTAWVSIGNEHA